MDGVKVAWRSFIAAHKFLFWALVAMVTRWGVVLLHVIDWHQEASREMTILHPKRPKDLYDNGYALFAYDINVDAWVGHWRAPDAKPGTPAAETFAWREQWAGIPFHEVEFTAMPEIVFKVRAIAVTWCRQNLKLGEGAELLKAVMPQIYAAVKEAEQRATAQAVAEAETPKVVH